MLLKLRKTKTIGKPRINIEKKNRERKFLTSLIRLVPLELIDETLMRIQKRKVDRIEHNNLTTI